MNHKDLALDVAQQLSIKLKEPKLVSEVKEIFDASTGTKIKLDEGYEKQTTIILFFNLLVMITSLVFEIYKYHDSNKQSLPSQQECYEEILETLDRNEINYNLEDVKIIFNQTINVIDKTDSLEKPDEE